MSNKNLVHFDPEKKIILTCDASPYGISAVLAHRFEENRDRPVCFASRTLSPAEKGYPHIEKEGLAIIFGVRKFFEYLFGNEFILQTDNAALTRIFHPEKEIPEIAAARLQRWAIFLAPFRYTVTHIKGQNNYADWLSRLPLPESEDKDTPVAFLNEIEFTQAEFIKEIDFASLDWRVVQKETQKDQLLNKIIRQCMDGWSETQPEEEVLKSFWLKRDALTVDKKCLFWGHRIIIPEKLRALILHELHSSHFGVTRMKELARSFVWWPHIDLDIERVVKQCRPCLETRKSPPKIPLTPWTWPISPWHRIHSDFLGPFHGKVILIMIDSHSKWPEAFIVPNMNEETTINVFQEVFSRFGYPVHLVTDNYATFVGKAFQNFAKETGQRHSTTPARFPATNGAAENFVGAVKRKLTCLMKDGYNMPQALTKFLFDYRATPHAATGKTPANLMIGRDLRTKFSILRPPAIGNQVADYQAAQMRNYRGTRKISFAENLPVMVRDHKQGKDIWIPGKIIRESTPGVTYEVQIADGRKIKRHANQIIERVVNTDETKEEIESPASKKTEVVPRRSARIQAKRIV